jgi:hypothetical protein
VSYTFTAPVLGVEEKFAPQWTTGKNETGEWLYATRSLGWFVRITSEMSIRVGPERPDIVAGDVVLLTLEKI